MCFVALISLVTFKPTLKQQAQHSSWFCYKRVRVRERREHGRKKNREKQNSWFCYQHCHCWLCRWDYQVSHFLKEVLSSQKIVVISWSTVHKLLTDRFLWCSLISYCFIQKFPTAIQVRLWKESLEGQWVCVRDVYRRQVQETQWYLCSLVQYYIFKIFGGTN